MTHKKTIIIVGGAHGGAIAASAARQCNEQAQILLVEQAPYLLPKISLPEELVSKEPVRNVTKFCESLNIDVLLNTRAVALDMDSRTLVIDRGLGVERLAFHTVIFATGSLSTPLSVPGLLGPRVCHFRTREDSDVIRSALSRNARVVVVGGDHQGIEAATTLQRLGCAVTVIERSKRFMTPFSWQTAERMRRALLQQGISVLLDCEITEADSHDLGVSLKTTHGTTLDCELVVICLGISPRTSILTQAGAATLANGKICVDDYLETSLRDIYACGSIIDVPHAVTNQAVSVVKPCVTARTARIAGTNAASSNTSQRMVLKPSAYATVLTIGATTFARTGLSHTEARTLLGDDRTLLITACSEKSSEHREVGVKLIVDKSNQTIVGGEVFGHDGVIRNIDVLSIAVAEGFGPRWIANLDRASFSASSNANLLEEACLRAKAVIDDAVNVMTSDMLALWFASKRDFRLVDVSDTPLLSGRMAQKAMHVPLSSLQERIDELRSSSLPLVVFSDSAHESYRAQCALRQHGINDVYHLDSGVEWFHLMAKEE